MKRTTRVAVAAFLLLSLTAAIRPPAADAAPKTKFKIAWSIYVGWMPWGYGSDEKIIKKWADKYGIEIEVVQVNDYIESINQYTSGQFDGCSMTNMDALTIPAAGGVDSTGLIVGDFSNGNDGIVLKKQKELKAIKGQKVHLVELSVSHYLLARALSTISMTEKDVTVVNVSDADVVAAFATPDVTAMVTWNPQLSEIKKAPDAAEVFDSSKIPGEIIDLLVVNTATLKDNPALGKALVGAWYEMMGLLEDKGEKGTAARTAMAKASGTDLAGFDSQLATTRMFFTPSDALSFMRGASLPATMDHVRGFSFEHGLLGAGAKSADAVGISYPGDKTAGDKANVKLRFDDTFTAMAAAGELSKPAAGEAK